MAQFNVTASQLQTATQRVQSKYIQIELLNNNFQVLDNLEGVAIEGNITISANSDMRRTGNIKIVVTDSSFEVQPGGKIFLDKYLRLKVGTYSMTEDEIIYTNCGIFIIDSPSYVYDASTKTLSLSLLDLMAKLTGARNGYLPGVPIKLLAGESIREAIIDTLALGGFNRYVVEDTGTLPITLDFPQGSSIYTVLNGLKEIYPNYEIYFDNDGVFHYSMIPTGENEQPQIDDILWDRIVISESSEIDFQSIKNSIEVLGRTHDPAHFSTETVINNNDIILTIPDVTTYEDGIIYGFALPDNITINSPKLKINQLALYSLEDDEGTVLSIQTNDTEEYLCVRWNQSNMAWDFLGHLQARGIAEDTNIDSPFYVDGEVGKIHLVLYGGDYDNIATDSLALQRAQYELWCRTQLQTTIKLTCTVVEWLEVNALISYTKQMETVPSLWIIKSVNYGLDFDATMTVELTKFYPNYFYI